MIFAGPVGAELTSPYGLIRRFLKAEDGLATLEWASVGAALVIGVLLLSWAVFIALTPAADTIGGTIEEASAPHQTIRSNGGTP